MKTPEDEAFDELARKQGAWGGGYQAKRKAAADKQKLWDKPSVAFDEWWYGDNDESTNPFWVESGAYWAWAGWKAALAQPVQEPVAWADLQKKAQQIVESKFLWNRFIDGTPLANDIACWMADFAQQYTTPPQPVQEPRNVRERWNVELDGNDLLVCFNDHEKGDACQYERYSPQRPWVGLTDDDIFAAAKDLYGTAESAFMNRIDDIATARAIEQLLKEKNNG